MHIIETTKDNITRIELNENDNHEGVIEVKIVKKGKAVNLSGKSVKLAIVKKDESKGDIIEGITVKEAINGIINIPITTVLTRRRGFFNGMLAIYNNSGFIEHTGMFNLKFREDLFENSSKAILNSSTFDKLRETLAECEESLINFRNSKIKTLENFKNEKNEVITKFKTEGKTEADNRKKEWDSLKKIAIKENNAVELQSQINVLDKALKSNQSLEYRGENITCNDTLFSRTENLQILGSTIKNYANVEFKEKNEFQDLTTNAKLEGGFLEITPKEKYENFFFRTMQLEPLAKYTIVLEVKENSCKSGSIVLSNPYNSQQFNEMISIELNTLTRNNIYTYVVTSKSDLSTQALGLRSYLVNAEKGGKIKFRLMILKGDWTTKHTPNFFTGLSSVGEEEKNIIKIKSCGRNLATVKEGDSNFQIGRIEHNKTYTLKVKRKNNISYSLRLNTQSGKLFKWSIEEDVITFKNNYKNGFLFYNAYGQDEVSEIILIEGEYSRESFPKDIEFKEDKKQIQLPFSLKSVGENRDRIYEKNGVVWLEQNVKQIELTGEEKWQLYKRDENISYFYHKVSENIAEYLCVSDKLQSLKSGDYEKSGVTVGGYPANEIIIFLTKEKLRQLNIKSVEDFKLWLSKTKPTVFYPLETPIITELNIKNIDLDTFSPVTHITSDNNIQPILNFKVPSNLASIVQSNSRAINEIYDLIDTLITPQLIQNRLDIDINKI